MIQMMCDCIVRYMDDEHNLTEEMEQAMSIFEHMEGWKDALNLADPTGDRVIGEAIYFLYDPNGGKKGTRAIHVVKPFFGSWTQDANIQNIIDNVFRLLTPELHKRLWAMGLDMNCGSLIELFGKLIVRYEKEQDAEELRKLFEDDARAPNDKPVVYGERTKRKPHHDVDEQQLTISFAQDDEQNETTSY